MEATRQTLLERLRDPSAERAWEEFYAIYGGVILAYARKLGLDDAGAKDALQETMIALIRVLPTFRYDRGKGLFRNFLLTIVHRRALQALRRRTRDLSREVSLDEDRDEEGTSRLDRAPDPGAKAPSAEMDERWREAVLAEALRRLEGDPRIKPKNLEAFRAYAIEGQPAEEVARRFKMKENALYAIKNRMIARLAEEAHKLENFDGA